MLKVEATCPACQSMAKPKLPAGLLGFLSHWVRPGTGLGTGHRQEDTGDLADSAQLATAMCDLLRSGV